MNGHPTVFPQGTKAERTPGRTSKRAMLQQPSKVPVVLVAQLLFLAGCEG